MSNKIIPAHIAIYGCVALIGNEALLLGATISLILFTVLHFARGTVANVVALIAIFVFYFFAVGQFLSPTLALWYDALTWSMRPVGGIVLIIILLGVKEILP